MATYLEKLRTYVRENCEAETDFDFDPTDPLLLISSTKALEVPV